MFRDREEIDIDSPWRKIVMDCHHISEIKYKNNETNTLLVFLGM